MQDLTGDHCLKRTANQVIKCIAPLFTLILHVMKTLMIALVLCTCHTTNVCAQFSFGFRLGKAPSVSPGTSYLMLNRNDPLNESLFNIEQVNFSEQFGLMIRTEGPNFWFSVEVLYGQSKTRYSMIYTREALMYKTDPVYYEKKSFLDIPLSAGVKLGVIEIFSGFSITKDLTMASELSTIDGFQMSMSQAHLGWHSGIGVNFGHVLMDIRYQQQFNNYGQGQFINQQELVLKNAPTRVLITAGFRF